MQREHPTYKEHILEILDKEFYPVYTNSHIVDMIMEIRKIPRELRAKRKRRLEGPVSSQLYRMYQDGILYRLGNYGCRGGCGYGVIKKYRKEINNGV